MSDWQGADLYRDLVWGLMDIIFLWLLKVFPISAKDWTGSAQYRMTKIDQQFIHNEVTSKSICIQKSLDYMSILESTIKILILNRT